jgi:hypothetical protein
VVDISARKSERDPHRPPSAVYPRPVRGLGMNCPTAALLIDGGSKHVVCHDTRLSGFTLHHEEHESLARPVWEHQLPGRVVAVIPFGLHDMAALVEVDGMAVLVAIVGRQSRQIATAPGTPTALCALGAKLAFAVIDQDQECWIKVVQASGRVVAKVLAPARVSSLGYDARQDQILAFSVEANRLCWISYNAGIRRPGIGSPSSAIQRLPPNVIAAKPKSADCPCCNQSPVAQPAEPACQCDKPSGCRCDPSDGGGSYPPRDGMMHCESGGPGIVDGCFAFIIVDGRRLVRIDLCRPGARCETPMDRPVQQLRKVGAYLIGQGQGGRFMTQIDPATMKIVRSRAFPRGSAVLSSHTHSDMMLVFDTRQRTWHALDLAAAAEDLKATPGTAGDAGSHFGGL